MISINIPNSKKEYLVNLYNLAVDEVSNDLFLLNHNKTKWPLEYIKRAQNLKNSGEQLWILIPSDHALNYKLTSKLARLDILISQARGMGLV